MGDEVTLPRFEPAGDAGLLIVYGDRIDLSINGRVHALARVLQQKPLAGFIECVPAYCTLLVQYDPLITDFQHVLAWVKECSASATESGFFEPLRVEIPTVYGGEYGPDLDFVADYHHISPEDVIRIHTSVIYQVYMLGFTPGFAYLGGMDAAIATPRLEKPRTHLPAGSVGIAGQQTGIYPLDSPGGWRIIGRTPLHLFNPLAEPPVCLAPGDQLRFFPILATEFSNGIENG